MYKKNELSYYYTYFNNFSSAISLFCNFVYLSLSNYYFFFIHFASIKTISLENTFFVFSEFGNKNPQKRIKLVNTSLKKQKRNSSQSKIK